MRRALANRTSLNACFGLLLFCSAVLYAERAKGQDITVEIAVDPQDSSHPVFIVGHYATCRALSFNPPPPPGVQVSGTWSRRCPGGLMWETQPEWSLPTVTIHHSKVGQLEYKCDVTYSDGRRGTASKTIEVMAPNLREAHGLGEDSTGFPAMMLELRFRWIYKTDGGTKIPIGSPVDGYAQERIRREPPWSPEPVDSGWTPAPGTQSTEYFFDPPDSVDRKLVSLQTQQNIDEWHALPIGSLFDEYYQANRVVFSNYCDGSTVITSGERKYRKRKSAQEAFTVFVAAE